eukprot:s1440_g9.t1
MVSFEPSTVYGNRTAWQEVLLVTSSDGRNMYHKTALWRQGLISDVMMLPRSEMVKPPRGDSKYGADTRFTKVQEMKQARRKMACATVCHTKSEAGFVSGLLSTKLFGMARNAEYKISGFPDFSGTLTDLKQFQRSPQPSYEVTVPTGNGALVIKESLIQFWTVKHQDFQSDMENLVKQHNQEFNPEGLKQGAEAEAPEADEEGPPTKKITLNAGSFSLHLDENQGQLWIGCSTAEHTELFGFGSGEFAKGSEAQDLMTADGRWLRYYMDSSDAMVILEKQRKTPDHLENAAFFNKVMSLNNVLKSLEDTAEVGVQLAEHQLTKDSAGNFSVKPLDNVCFALDEVKPKKKKAKALVGYYNVVMSQNERCDIDTSGTSSAEKSEDKEVTTGGANDANDEEPLPPVKRPAAKTTGGKSKKKKEEDEEVTQLGTCKGNQDREPDDDDDAAPAGSRRRKKKKEDRDEVKKTRGKSKKESGGGKKRHTRKKGRSAAADDDGASTSSYEPEDTEKVTENMLAEALKRAQEAEDRAEGRNKVPTDFKEDDGASFEKAKDVAATEDCFAGGDGVFQQQALLAHQAMLAEMGVTGVHGVPNTSQVPHQHVMGAAPTDLQNGMGHGVEAPTQQVDQGMASTPTVPQNGMGHAVAPAPQFQHVGQPTPVPQNDMGKGAANHPPFQQTEVGTGMTSTPTVPQNDMGKGAAAHPPFQQTEVTSTPTVPQNDMGKGVPPPRVYRLLHHFSRLK